MTSEKGQTAVWLGVLFLLLTGLGVCCSACGPDFPNWLLADGDNAVLRAPEAFFGKELQRLRLGNAASAARVSDNPKDHTVEMDLADLRTALERAHLPPPQSDSIIARYREERTKLAAFSATSSPSDSNAPPAAISLPQVPPDLPPEFADYFRGAIAWHQTNLAVARSEWKALLKRPPAQRHFKSTWAAFMLGKSWESADANEAIAWYQRVRELAQSGFADSLGLAVESLGWEARLEWQRKHYASAFDLYLKQYAAGDPTAEASLRFVAADALRQGRQTLDPLARHPNAQRLITAYVISGGYRQPAIDVDDVVKETSLLLWSKTSAKVSVIPAPNTSWHKLRPPALLWLQAVESAKVRDLESAEQLALAAYQAGEMDFARRWLERARPTPTALWLRAKLCIRDGKVDEATQLLAKVAGAVPATSTATGSSPSRDLAASLFVSTSGEYGNQMPASSSEALRGELAVTQVAHRRYVEALDSLLHSSPAYWMDAAYLAERVLSLEELKGYVEHESSKPNPGNSYKGNQEQSWPGRDFYGGEGLRYLLARRLARSYRFPEARPYYPTNWVPFFDQLTAAWQAAEDTILPKTKRGSALLEAAVLTRKYGLELLGTEVEPDWRIHQGDFEEGVTVNLRASLRGSNYLAATSDEIQKASSHRVQPEWRWHYRSVAAVIGWEAAKLIREGAAEEREPAARSRKLFEAASTLNQAGIGCLPLGVNLSMMVNERGTNTTISSRVARTLGALSSIGSQNPERLLSRPGMTPEKLWQCGFTSAALAWDAAQLLPNNSDETARILCRGGSWIAWDPQAADVLYKALVRRCRKTAIGAEADRLHWFPKLDQKDALGPQNAKPASPAATGGA